MVEILQLTVTADVTVPHLLAKWQSKSATHSNVQYQSVTSVHSRRLGHRCLHHSFVVNCRLGAFHFLWNITLPLASASKGTSSSSIPFLIQIYEEITLTSFLVRNLREIVQSDGTLRFLGPPCPSDTPFHLPLLLRLLFAFLSSAYC